MDRKEIEEKISIVSAELKTKLTDDQFFDFEMYAIQSEMGLSIVVLLYHLIENNIKISK